MIDTSGSSESPAAMAQSPSSPPAASAAEMAGQIMQVDGAGLDMNGQQLQTPSASSTYNPFGNTSILNMQQFDPVQLSQVNNTVINHDLH